MSLRWVRIAAVLGALAVILGAFGAHALERRLDERALEVWQTANRYHFIHALSLLGLGLWEGSGGRGARLAASAWLLGMTVFCGGLYLYSLTGLKVGAMLAPLGGLSLAAGWLALVRLEAGPPR
jgi:uncharacterized membrane protein YgdD (TMEM256/DUF423 family)